MNKLFLPKVAPDMPDFFNITIKYITGIEETLPVVKVDIFGDVDIYRIRTFDNKMIEIPYSNVLKMEYDSNWSKIEEINRREEKNKLTKE